MTVKDVSQSQLHICYTVDLYFKHPQTKLQEGNAFTDICLSIGGSHAQQPLAMMHWISLYLPLPPPDMGPRYISLLLTSDGHHWKPIQNCSFEDLPPPPPVLTCNGDYRNVLLAIER